MIMRFQIEQNYRLIQLEWMTASARKYLFYMVIAADQIIQQGNCGASN